MTKLLMSRKEQKISLGGYLIEEELCSTRKKNNKRTEKGEKKKRLRENKCDNIFLYLQKN